MIPKARIIQGDDGPILEFPAEIREIPEIETIIEWARQYRAYFQERLDKARAQDLTGRVEALEASLRTLCEELRALREGTPTPNDAPKPSTTNLPTDDRVW